MGNLKLKTVDFNLETGKLYLSGVSESDEYCAIEVNVEQLNGRQLSHYPEGQIISAADVEQETTLLLPFHYEVYAIQGDSLDLQFTIDISDFQTEDGFDVTSFIKLNEQEIPSETPYYIPKDAIVTPTGTGRSFVEIDVWGKDLSGLKDFAISGSNDIAEGENFEPERVCFLPVFSWEATPTKSLPRIALLDGSGNLEFYIYDKPDISVRQTNEETNVLILERQIPASQIPLENRQAIEIAGKLNTQPVYVSDDTACIRLDTDFLNILSYFSNEDFASVRCQDRNGNVWALSSESGGLYRVVEETPNIPDVFESESSMTSASSQSTCVLYPSESSISSTSSVSSSSTSSFSSPVSSSSSCSTVDISTSSLPCKCTSWNWSPNFNNQITDVDITYKTFINKEECDDINCNLSLVFTYIQVAGMTAFDQKIDIYWSSEWIGEGSLHIEGDTLNPVQIEVSGLGGEHPNGCAFTVGGYVKLTPTGRLKPIYGVLPIYCVE